MKFNTKVPMPAMELMRLLDDSCHPRPFHFVPGGNPIHPLRYESEGHQYWVEDEKRLRGTFLLSNDYIVYSIKNSSWLYVHFPKPYREQLGYCGFFCERIANFEFDK